MKTSFGPDIAVVTLGEPLDRKTWSGTAANLCEALKARGQLGATYNAELYASPWITKGVRAATKVYYRNSPESSRGLPTRALRARGLRRFLQREQPSVVLHLGTLALPLLAGDRPERHFLYCDMTWHSWLQHSTLRHRYLAALVRDAEDLERKAYGQMEHIFAISEHVQESLLAYYGVAPSKVSVVGTGRGGIQPFHAAKDYTTGRILFVAKERFEDKGGAMLLEAFQLARVRLPHLRLVLVGQEKYLQLAATIPGVEAFAYVTLEQLQTLFNEAALFALPALNEPWGLVFLEALSCRTPLLGLARLAFPEISGQGAYGFAAAAPTREALAEAIILAFSSPDRLEQMGQAGQAHVLEHCTWEKTIDRMLKVINAGPGASSLTRPAA